MADLSCEKLFMNYQDLNSGVRPVERRLGHERGLVGRRAVVISTADPEKFFASVLAN